MRTSSKLMTYTRNSCFSWTIILSVLPSRVINPLLTFSVSAIPVVWLSQRVWWICLLEICQIKSKYVYYFVGNKHWSLWDVYINLSSIDLSLKIPEVNLVHFEGNLKKLFIIFYIIYKLNIIISNKNKGPNRFKHIVKRLIFLPFLPYF